MLLWESSDDKRNIFSSAVENQNNIFHSTIYYRRVITFKFNQIPDITIISSKRNQIQVFRTFPCMIDQCGDFIRMINIKLGFVDWIK